MLLFLPYAVDVPMSRWPISNFLLIAAISLVSLAALYGGMPGEAIDAMVLDGWSPVGMIGSIFLHLDLVHLVGNMVFLWVFGNAVCAKVGNLLYPLMFLGFGLVGGATHNVMVGGPAAGASDAITGAMGFFLFWYARNDITCVWVFLIRVGTVRVSSVFVLLGYLAFDLYGAATGGSDVAYAAHVGGFAAGFASAFALAVAGAYESTSYEQNLLEVYRAWRERNASAPQPRSRRHEPTQHAPMPTPATPSSPAPIASSSTAITAATASRSPHTTPAGKASAPAAATGSACPA